MCEALTMMAASFAIGAVQTVTGFVGAQQHVIRRGIRTPFWGLSASKRDPLLEGNMIFGFQSEVIYLDACSGDDFKDTSPCTCAG